MLSKIASLEVCAEAHLLREMYALAGSGKRASLWLCMRRLGARGEPCVGFRLA